MRIFKTFRLLSLHLLCKWTHHSSLLVIQQTLRYTRQRRRHHHCCHHILVPATHIRIQRWDDAYRVQSPALLRRRARCDRLLSICQSDTASCHGRVEGSGSLRWASSEYTHRRGATGETDEAGVGAPRRLDMWSSVHGLGSFCSVVVVVVVLVVVVVMAYEIRN